MHARGVVHLDLKESNVLLGSDGRIVLADFGLSARKAAISQLVQEHTFVLMVKPSMQLSKSRTQHSDVSKVESYQVLHECVRVQSAFSVPFPQ
jgi:serine/threonine protein kinase